MVYIPKVNVYIWPSVGNGDLGHASMDITETDGSSTFVSFWPGVTLKKEFKHLFTNSKCYMPENYAEDCYKMNRAADKIIYIHNLPNPRGIKIASYKMNWALVEYKVTSTNCCHVVMSNLTTMSGISVTSPQSWHPAWSPQDVRNYADFLSLQPFPKPLTIEGTVGYTISGSTVKIRADKLVNNRKGGTSKTLMLRFWATKSLNGIINIKNSHVFAEKQIDPLKGGFDHSSIKCTVNYHSPPEGRYYIVATLHEYEKEDDWPIYDRVNFDRHRQVELLKGLNYSYKGTCRIYG